MFLSIVAIALAMALIAVVVVWRSLRSARTLRNRCTAELVHLKSLVTNRHLILSHLSDSIPASINAMIDRSKLDRRRLRAEKALQAVDPSDPVAADIRNFGDLEQRLLELVEELRKVLEESNEPLANQPIQGCLDGLEKVDAEIMNSVSTYNASAITFAGFLDNSVIARRYYHCDFSLVDLDPQASCISTNRFAS